MAVEGTKIMSAVDMLTLVRSIEAHKVAQGKPASVHVVFDGLNEALRLKGYNARESTSNAVAKGTVYGRGAKGGYLLSSKPFTATEASSARVSEIVSMIDTTSKPKVTRLPDAKAQGSK